jgi:hypothetical protein
MCDPQTEILLMAATQWQTKFQGNNAKEKKIMWSSPNAFYVTPTL